MAKVRKLSTGKGFGTLRKELGQAGLIATSVNLWRSIVEQRRPWSLILEDDIIIDDDLERAFATGWFRSDLAVQNASLIYLGWCHAYRGKEESLLPGCDLWKLKVMLLGRQ